MRPGAKMIDSCAECKTNCCKIGPGPYRIVSPREYVERFGDLPSYNTECAALDSKSERCTLWGTPEFPEECKTYICHVRSFSKSELSEIRRVN